MNTPCPLCHSSNVAKLCEDTKRPYLKCDRCALVFVPKAFHLAPEQEKAIYDQHENNPEDFGYRDFLNRLMAPLVKYIPDGAKGLDFGSGPGPTLSVMLEENGYEMSIYDPYFANKESVLNNSYDFVTSTEVVEHLSDPKSVFEKLFHLVEGRGVIGLMTKLIPSYDHFEKWHYVKDPTHITFYAEETFHYLAEQYNYQAIIVRNDVVILIPNDTE